MKTFQRILAVVIALVMSLSVIGMVAFAAETDVTSINKDAKGSITVYKYEYDGTVSELPRGDGTANPTTIPETAKELPGVTFKIYQVKDTDDTIAYYNGEASASVTVNDFVANGAIKAGYSEVTAYANGLVTGADGKVEFKELPVGMYVIIESDAPDKVTQKAEPFLVSVPMTNPTNDAAWMYDVYAYPKNNTSEGTVTLKKTDKSGTGLDGVEFTLEKKDEENWVAVEEAENDTTFTTANGGVIPWTGLAHGDYRITETKTLPGYILDQRPIAFTVTENNTITCADSRACIDLGETNGTAALTITLVNEKPDTDKKVVEGDAKAEDGNAGVGDTVKYEVTVDVPLNITDLKTFTLTDTPRNLNDDSDTIVIKCGETTLTKETHYTVADSVDGNGFTIDFVETEMGDFAGKQIVVTYDAVVLSGAASGTAENTAELIYSNKIKPDSDSSEDGEGDKNHITDKGIVYTYKIDITKYKDSVADANKLAGVEFELYSDADLTKAVKVTGTDGNYVADPTGTTTTLVTGDGGKLIVAGLDAGTYYLKETKTVDGYNLLKGAVEVNVNLDTTTEWSTSQNWVQTENGGWTLAKETDASTTYKNGNDIVESNAVAQNIINKKGFDLPQTGGLGTLMFILIGGVLIAGGVCLITVPNKKRAA